MQAPLIYLLGDERLEMPTTKSVLQAGGYQNVVSYNNWQATRGAMEILPPDLLLLDILLPELPIFDTLSFCRERCPQTRVVIISALDSVECAVLCLKLGAADYFPKPYPVERLLSCVRELLFPR